MHWAAKRQLGPAAKYTAAAAQWQGEAPGGAGPRGVLPSDVRCGLSGVVCAYYQEGIPRGHAFMCLDMAKLPQTMREIFTQNDLM